MPVHRVPLDDTLEAAVAAIETTERIVGTSPAGDGAVVIFTDPKPAASKRAAPGNRETR